MTLITELHSSTNRTAFTENGALSNTSTLNPVLDFFSKAGAMRGDEVNAFKLFNKAFAADPLAAIRCLFYLRDIRGGQGERSVFRYIIGNLDNELIIQIIQYIPEYGRWDEVPLTEAGIEFILTQLNADLAAMDKGESISLLAKWLPSEGSSRNTQALKLAKAFDLKPGEYRRVVSALRKHLKLLEHAMSQNEWSGIEFDKLPSQAHKKHVKAFFRNDGARYKSYLDSVEKGEKKINSGTLFTYDLYEMVNDWNTTADQERAADALWANLPDYTRGNNALVLADVSDSMNGRPMSISVSLALYFAERNEGPFKDYFLTFSERPRLQKITGDTLGDKMRSIESSDWGMSTNLQSAFNAILNSALKSDAKEEDMPSTLYVISDMQFNTACNANNKTNFEVMAEKYEDAGFVLPHVVFWNVYAYGNDAPATMYDDRVTLISGSSQSTFQYAVAGKTPMEAMLDIINSDRYEKINLDI